MSLELVIPCLHFIEDIQVNFLLRMLDVVVKMLVIVWVEGFELWFLFILEINVDMVHTECACFTHGVNVLTE